MRFPHFACSVVAKSFGWLSLMILLSEVANAGVIFGANGLSGGSRWDAAPRIIAGRERSLAGGLRFSVAGGSYEAFRDQFAWAGTKPSVDSFQTAIEDAFHAWTVDDPATGLSTSLSFVPDFATPVVGTSTFGGVNVAGAEIDLLAKNVGVAIDYGYTNFDAIASPVTLTSGVMNYPGSFAISGADISINNNPGEHYTLPLFRRLLTNLIGHAIGFGDVEGSINPGRFIDDNYDGTNSTTARLTLTNSWAALVNPVNPAASPLQLYDVPDNSLGFDAPGVNLLLEANGLGIAAGNNLGNLFPLTSDEYGMRQFLYPQPVPEPRKVVLLVSGAICLLRFRSKCS